MQEIYWVNGNITKESGYICPNCDSIDIDFEIMLGRIRIIECHGYSSKSFMKLKNNAKNNTHSTT